MNHDKVFYLVFAGCALAIVLSIASIAMSVMSG
jgi:hypothetical protein